MGAIFAGILAAILLIFSGFASGSEIAFFSLSPNDLNELKESNSDRDKQILALGEDSERTLATIHLFHQPPDQLRQCRLVAGVCGHYRSPDLPASAFRRDYSEGLLRTARVGDVSQVLRGHHRPA